VVSASAGNAVLEQFLGNAGYLTMLQYSRSMESQADDEATRAVLALYGNLNGADDLFKILQKETGDKQPSKFFSTHPLTASRIARIESYQAKHPAGGNNVTSLPTDFSQWLKSGKGDAKNSVEDCSNKKIEETKIAACD
jgi:predicted Zn-dependent protease